MADVIELAVQISGCKHTVRMHFLFKPYLGLLGPLIINQCYAGDWYSLVACWNGLYCMLFMLHLECYHKPAIVSRSIAGRSVVNSACTSMSKCIDVLSCIGNNALFS